MFVFILPSMKPTQKKVSTRGISGMLLSCKEKSNYVWENLTESNKIVDF